MKIKCYIQGGDSVKSSEQIKEIRSRLNLSQSELAEKLGVSFAAVRLHGRRLRYGHRVHRQRPHVCGIGPLLQWRNHGFGSDQQSIRLETGKTVCGSDRTGVRPNQNLGRATYLRGRP